MRKIYFAHPVNLYDTPLENVLMIFIQSYFPDMEIENPNQPHHKVGYNKRATRIKESGLDDNPMNYFYEEVLPNCGSCVAVPFLDGRIGGGVAGEMQWFVEHDKPIWIACPHIDPTAEDLFGVVGYPLTDYFFIRPITSTEILGLISNDTKLVISREETRLRTWRVYNRERRPYEEAHLVKMPVPDGFYPQG